MPSASNDAELKKMLKAPLQTSVNVVMSAVEKEGHNKIITTVYSYGATEYPRTDEFSNAWESEEGGSVGNIANGTYDYNPDKVTVGSGWPAIAPYSGVHQSFVYGAPSANELPDYIYEGYQGALTKRIPERNAFKKLDNWLSERQVVLQFKRGLRWAGLKVTKQGGATKTVT